MFKSSSRGWVIWVPLLVYVLGFALGFQSDFLGRSPALDARENLALANELSAYGFAREPIYRAMLYPWLLSFFSLDQARLVWGATMGGALLHVINSFLVGLISSMLWRERASGFVSSVLYLVYPVSLFFSVQLLDITFSITLFLTSVYLFMRSSCKAASKRSIYLFLSGLFCGLTVLARPNFLPAVLLMPLWGGVFSGWGMGIFNIKKAFLSVALVGLPLLCVLILQGFLNYSLSGVFKILPWQGSYNLYAANRDGANGKYYQQRVAFSVIPEGQNPTRMESEVLYRKAKGLPDDQKLDITEMGHHWRSQLIAEIRRDPLRWLSLMGCKTVYLLNDWEQYNNLSYHYHKERFTFLRYNPLSWGVLFASSLLAMCLVGKRAEKREFLLLLSIIGAYSLGVLMFFVSARFRLPLASLLCILSGGMGFVRFRSLKQREIFFILGILLVGGLLAFPNWLNARDRSTFVQDKLLLANSALNLGYDLDALRYTNAALGMDPSLQAAVRIKIASLFNLWLSSSKEIEYWEQLGDSLSLLRDMDPVSGFIQGVYYWREGYQDEAEQIWLTCSARYGEAARSSAHALEITRMPAAEINSVEDRQFRDLFE